MGRPKRPHQRTSVKGKKFKAGRGKSDPKRKLRAIAKEASDDWADERDLGTLMWHYSNAMKVPNATSEKFYDALLHYNSYDLINYLEAETGVDYKAKGHTVVGTLRVVSKYSEDDPRWEKDDLRTQDFEPTDRQNDIIWGYIEKLQKQGKVYETLYTGNPISVEASSYNVLEDILKVMKKTLAPEKVELERDYFVD